MAIYGPVAILGKCRMKGKSSLLIAVLITVLAGPAWAGPGPTSSPRPFAFHQDLFGQSGFGAQTSFQVPAGRMLVIEAVTAQISLPTSGQSVTLYRITTRTGNSISFYNVPVFEQGVGTGIFVAGQQVRLYAAPGSHVQLLMRRNSNQGGFNFLPGLSGYLIDPNSPSLGP